MWAWSIDADRLRDAPEQSLVQHPAHSPATSSLLRIGTRGSPLALAQAQMVRDRLAAAHGLTAERIEIVTFRTSGDRIQDRTLSEAGGKGLFTKELEEALLTGAIDLAVHSAKDMPTEQQGGLVIGGVLPREDPRDAFISPKADSLRDLPPGAVVGTASLRRQAMVRMLRPDVTVIPFRGNVETRLRKLAEGEADATLLALAGLKRLGMAERATAILGTDEFLPAAGQGIVAIEVRGDDAHTFPLVAAIGDAAAATALTAERAFLAVLDGSCRTPIGGLAEIAGETLHFRGLIARPDGTAHFATERRGPLIDAAALGASAGRELRDKAGPDFFVPA